MIQFQEKARTNGKTEGQTEPFKALPATARGPTITNAVDWHVRVKITELDVDLTKNYCMTVSKQKISSIHNLTLKIETILGSHELNVQGHF